ncbi:hypothetical protein LJB87_02040 [Alistipes sp. OttesenSCG-928-L06]|nr:hypothetical protein [Alistipes sp. OttesenSCG-928-L06]
MTNPDNENQLYTQALKALTERVMGYTLTEQKKTYVYENGRKKVKDEVVSKKEIGPDLAAIQFVLTNLAPQRWSGKPDTRETDGYGLSADEKPDLSRLSEAALEELNRICAP